MHFPWDFLRHFEQHFTVNLAAESVVNGIQHPKKMTPDSVQLPLRVK